MRAPLGYGKESHFSDKGYSMRGVVHVGMNDGEEITWYAHVGRLPVLGFEPNPAVYAECCANYAPEIADGRAKIVNCGLGSKKRKMSLHVLMGNNHEFDTKGASCLELDEAARGQMGWTDQIIMMQDVEVQIRRFDEWVRSTEHDLSPYDVLVMDVQGMELDALQGFGKHLKHFKYLMIECSHPPLYAGEADALEVSRWLLDEGFYRDSPIVSHNDVMFIREDLI